MRKVIYLDNAATTPVRKEVILAMKPYWSQTFGNPGSITKMGVKAKQAVENSRKSIAEYLKARPQEITFTSGGTESNNLAIFGVVNNLEKKGMKISDMHFITSNIEHSSITECFRELERKGGKLDYLKVNDLGLVIPKDLRKILKSNTVLVSVHYANSEIGVVQPIKEIAKEIRHARKTHQGGTLILFHTDASQAGLYLNLNIQELGVDMMTLDAQKINGPKGVGILFKKSTLQISPIIFGGGQERGLRSGTENTPFIIAIAKSLELARKDFEKKAVKIKVIRDYFWQKIQKEIPEAVLNGDLENRLPNNLNISIPGIDSEFTIFCLDEAGIVCSTKSACHHEDDGSAVVRSLGKPEDIVKSTLRFSLGVEITKKDIDFVVKNLKEIVRNQKLASL
jgi:cysteine desulfurase